MKKLLFTLGTVVGALPLMAEPSIDSTTLTFVSEGKKATIRYTLTGAPAIVTLDIQTNTLSDASGAWVSIGGKKIQSVSGGVNMLVRESGSYEIVWKAGQDWGRQIKLEGGVIRAEVTAWATNRPPEWMVVGLQKEEDVRFYASADFIPHGVKSDIYKAEQLLMRKVPAAGVEWSMGETKAQREAATNNGVLRSRYALQEPSHTVMMFEDYYIGVYPVTVGQYANMCTRSERGGYNAYIEASQRPFCPIDNASVNAIRGTTDASTTYRWPEDGSNVSDDSAIGQLREKSGLTDFDLPTEEQWEFACRAGRTTSLNSGKELTEENCEELGWISSNCKVDDGKGTLKEQVHPVGLKQQNAWGLYDMHGNVLETTLTRGLFYDTPSYSDQLVGDWRQGGVTLAPLTYTLGTGVVKRGGSILSDKDGVRSGHRDGGSYTYAQGAMGGFRLCHPAMFR